VLPRALYPRFGETAGKMSGVDWLFGLDETDPWVKTYVTSTPSYYRLSSVHSSSL
jgi:hypothetical protein